MDNNDFILKIVAELEQKGIKTGFDKLKKELEKDPAKIDVILDTSGTVGKTKGSIKKLAAELHNELSVEISKLQKQGQDINFDLSVGDVEEVIQNVINHTKKLGESFDVASDKAQKFLAKFNKKSGGVLINSGEFKAVQEAINGLGDTHTIEDLNKAMNTLEVTYDNMSSKLRNSGKSLNPFINAKNEMATMDKTIEGISLEFEKLATKPEDVSNAIKELSVQQDKVNSYAVGTMEWADAYGHLQEMIRNVTKDISNLQKAQSAKSLQPQIDKIQLSMDNGHGASEYQNRINSIIASLEKYGVEATEAQNITASLQSTFDSMKGLSGQELVTQADKLEKEFKAVKVSVEEAKLSYDKLMQPASKEKITTTLVKVQKLLSNNTRVTSEVKNEWQSYVNRLSSGSDIAVKEINDINIRLKETESNMRSMGRLGFSWTDKLKQAWEKFGGWGFATGTMMTLYNQIRKIPQEVIKVNSAMVELTKVSDASASDIKKYFDEAAKSAKELGASVSDMINATADWSRLGYSLPDAKKLAEVATLYTNVGDGIDMSTANESLISTLQGFKMTAEEAIHVIDSFNEVANTEAIDSAGIGEALQRSASSMYAAGNTLEETIGLITAANAVVQDPDSIGTAYKTISMRIRGAKTEMEELGLETDGMVESTATLQKEIMALSGVDIMKDKNTFKSTYQILDELATKWQDLTDIQQASITELIAGKRQGNIISALMNNFETARRATETAVNSTGSALREQEEYEKGIEYSLKRLEAMFQTFANHILDSNFVKGIVDFGSNTIEVIDKITSKLGSLGTIGLGAGLFAGVKNTGKCRISVRIS